MNAFNIAGAIAYSSALLLLLVCAAYCAVRRLEDKGWLPLFLGFSCIALFGSAYCIARLCGAPA